LGASPYWCWADDETDDRFRTFLIGTTELQPKKCQEGFTTMIKLSPHFLKQQGFDQRLLLSTLFHELIHCFLFLSYCLDSGTGHLDYDVESISSLLHENGGHTSGFLRIATAIDNWAGPGVLRLCDVKADLENFRSASGGGGGWNKGQQCWERSRENTLVEALKPNSSRSGCSFPVYISADGDKSAKICGYQFCGLDSCYTCRPR
jgi:hypothetical protein